MIDKNGIEIKTGDVVEITGAYFKNDNGLYFVRRSAGDAGWCGNYHSLHKISKTGKISRASGASRSWPISIYTNDYMKRIEGNAWNEEYATIEVKAGINQTYIAEHFRQAAEALDAQIEYEIYNYGEVSECTKLTKSVKSHFISVAERITV